MRINHILIQCLIVIAPWNGLWSGFAGNGASGRGKGPMDKAFFKVIRRDGLARGPTPGEDQDSTA